MYRSMLGNDALSQLKQLKTDIRSTKEFFEGDVVGSMSSYGFIVNGDTRHFLPPNEMERVFPGDRVRYCLVDGRDDQKQAELDKLIESPTTELFGVYRVRGTNHFVEAEFGRSSRWLFVPPAKRDKHEDGDLVQAKVIRHPYKTGKAAVQVTKHFGAPSAAWAKHRFVEARYNLEPINEQLDVPSKPLLTRDLDLTDIPFVTIDSASTRDIDDALFAESTDNGYRLVVAIADPMAYIAEGDQLDSVARSRGTTTYLPGVQLPMMPSELATERCSLLPEQVRSALIITMQVSDSGEISDYEFKFANVQSVAKLSYNDVAAHIDGEKELEASEAVLSSIETLTKVQKAIYSWRSANCLVMEDRHDYGYAVNDEGQLTEAVIDRRNSAHRVVEECMLATNRTAGSFLASHNKGLFSAHAGFRDERLETVAQIVSEQSLSEPSDAIDLAQFKQIMQAASEKETADQPLRAPLTRMLQPGIVTPNPAPHFGLGFDHYATVTSPIRKYQDLTNHRAIASILNQTDSTLDQEAATTLGESIQDAQLAARRASNELEQWLSNEHYGAQLQGQTLKARIAMINAGGLAVQLIETGCEGFVDLRKQKPSLDQTYLRLTLGEQTFVLEQQLDVVVKGYDAQQRKLQLTLA